jgi:hypothetical protein
MPKPQATHQASDDPLDAVEILRREVLSVAGISVRVMDSVALAGDHDRGQVIITGSHGGASAGEYAARSRCLAVACNDAGGGKNEAGIAGLRALATIDVVAVAVAHTSARIGDGLDTWENGVLTYVNEPARRAGFTSGRPLIEQVDAYLARHPQPAAHAPALPPAKTTTRQVVYEHGSTRVLAMDSISFATRKEHAHVVVSASNGGKASGVVARVLGLSCVVCNDAGFGKDDAGIAGMRDLDAIGLPALTVSHTSAEISHGPDTWEHGVISYVNDTARGLGFDTHVPVRRAITDYLERRA